MIMVRYVFLFSMPSFEYTHYHLHRTSELRTMALRQRQLEHTIWLRSMASSIPSALHAILALMSKSPKFCSLMQLSLYSLAAFQHGSHSGGDPHLSISFSATAALEDPTRANETRAPKSTATDKDFMLMIIQNESLPSNDPM